jgi:glycosyltransferase involved in cell wall biosynthesis
MRKTKKSTVVTLLDSSAFGGAEQYVLDATVFLNNHGHKILIFTNNDHVKKIYKQHLKKNKINNFEVLDLPYVLDAIGNWRGLVKFFLHLPQAGIWFYQTLRDIKAREKDTICFLVGFTDRLAFSPIIKKLNTKLIWVDIGPLQPVFKRNWGFPKLLYNLTKKFPDHFATTSKFTLESMVKIGKIPKDKIALIYPGIKLFTTTAINKYRKLGLSWRKKQVSGDAEILIGFVGRMALENEVGLLISAFAKARKKTKLKMQLVLIGDGPEKENFQKKAQAMGLDPFVTFAGFVSTADKFSILAACDLFVFPRAWSWDGFGITTIEAMSIGTPVISPRFGPQMEIVEDNENGLNFDPHNSDDLAEKIIALSENKRMREKFSKKGLQTVQDNFSYKIMKKNTLQTINLV